MLARRLVLSTQFSFLEIENFSPSDRVSILNSLFMDLYDEQRNIVNFYNGKTLQSASMTNNEPVFSFNFQ